MISVILSFLLFGLTIFFLPGINNGKIRKYLLIISLFGMIFQACSIFSGGGNTISRNESGKGDKTENIGAYSGKNKTKIELKVCDRERSSKEKEKLLEQAIKEIDKNVFSKNKDKENIDDDLVLSEKYCNGVVRASWQTDGKYIDHKGKVKNFSLKKAVITEVAARLNVGGKEKIYSFKVKIIPADLDTEAGLRKTAEGMLEKLEEDTRERASFSLPAKLGKIRFSLEKKKSVKGFAICLMILAVVIMLPWVEKERRKEALKKRRKKLRVDYPDVVSELSLYISSGMSIRSAMNNIAVNYEKHKLKEKAERPGFELIKEAVRMMNSGSLELEAYEAIGKNSGQRDFRKLSLILMENLRQGSQNISNLLERETVEAEEKMRLEVKSIGEQISTKLMVPLIGMLLMLMIVLMVPGIWGMGI